MLCVQRHKINGIEKISDEPKKNEIYEILYSVIYVNDVE